jgi:ABC-2 type transport system permease protein
MIADATGTPSAPTPRGGTVFDIGYQRYTGPHEGRNRARIAVFKDGLRTALGFGRGARAKVLPWFFIALLGSIGLIMALVAGATERLAGPGAAEQLGLPSHSDFYGGASIILFVFAAVVAPELLCRDRREGTINLYLVRPLTGSDYVLARWGAFLAVMVAACWFPQIVLLVGLAMGDPTPVDYLRTHWLDVPRFLLAGAVMAVYATTLALLTASFTTRRAYASVFLVGLFVITTPFTIGLASEIEGTAGQWISMFNLTNIPVHVNDVIFGEASEITSEAPAADLSSTVRVSWFFAWTLVPGAALWARYRRMTP